MNSRQAHNHPVLILGAGRGGSALLEIFVNDSLIKVVAIVDPNPGAPGIQMAKDHGIPTYTSASEALQMCKDYSDCIIYNLTHDDTIIEEVRRVLGNKNVTSGTEAKLFWQIVTNLRDSKNKLETNQLELQTAHQEVIQANQQLAIANKDLESFSYSVSHDLRAPVRAIAGFSKMLQEMHANQLDAEAQRKLSIIQSETQRMGNLIDDLLAFSRLGRQEIKGSDLDIQDMVRNMYERLHSLHQGPEVEFRLGSLPQAHGDRALLEQVWANLLSNALKFSAKRDKPMIEVSAISDDKEHTYFVRDNGAGFDPQYQSKLFGVFQRLHRADEFAGTGVGLALAYRIVTRHGGRIWAESKPNEGATFYFTLPKEQTGESL
jgi:signal transduction histidine kinase